MKKFLSLALAVVLAFGVSISAFAAVSWDGGTPVSGTVKTKNGTVSVAGSYHKDQADGMFFQINKIRKEAGLPELAYNGDLLPYAKQRALEIAVSFSHTRPDGTKGLDIAKIVNGENLGLSQDDYLGTTGTYSDKVSSSPQSFMESASHRSLILDTDMNSLACYCFEYDGKVYWVQLYSQQPGTTTTSSNATSTTASTTSSKNSSTTSTTTSSKNSTTTTTAAKGTTTSATALTNDIKTALTAKESKVVLTNTTTISGDAFAAAATATKNNNPFWIYCDTTYSNSKSVLGRFYLPTEGLATLTSDLDVQILTGTAETNKIETNLSKWYSNKMAVVKVGTNGTLPVACEVSVKANVADMDTTKLVFTHYDQEKNTIVTIANPNYSIDSNGYLHFSTTSTGYIVVSEGKLSK